MTATTPEREQPRLIVVANVFPISDADSTLISFTALKLSLKFPHLAAMLTQEEYAELEMTMQLFSTAVQSQQNKTRSDLEFVFRFARTATIFTKLINKIPWVKKTMKAKQSV